MNTHSTQANIPGRARALAAGVNPASYPVFNPLHKVEVGRIFTRIAAGNLMTVVGVVSVPKRVIPEVQVMARINNQVYLDLKNLVDPKDALHHPSHIREGAIDHVMEHLQYRSYTLDDTLDLFMRETHLLPMAPGYKWMIVAGASKQHIPLPGPMGLYEIGDAGLRYTGVPAEIYNGSKLGQVLRECLWGAGGAWGMATSMEPNFYDRWIEGEREANAKRDPMFARFMEQMKAAGMGGMPNIYTEDEMKAREEMAARVMRRIVNGEAEDTKAQQAGQKMSAAGAARPGRRP